MTVETIVVGKKNSVKTKCAQKKANSRGKLLLRGTANRYDGINNYVVHHCGVASIECGTLLVLGGWGFLCLLRGRNQLSCFFFLNAETRKFFWRDGSARNSSVSLLRWFLRKAVGPVCPFPNMNLRSCYIGVSAIQTLYTPQWVPLAVQQLVLAGQLVLQLCVQRVLHHGQALFEHLQEVAQLFQNERLAIHVPRRVHQVEILE